MHLTHKPVVACWQKQTVVASWALTVQTFLEVFHPVLNKHLFIESSFLENRNFMFSLQFMWVNNNKL